MERNPENAADELVLNFNNGLLAGDVSNLFVSALQELVGQAILTPPDMRAKLVATPWCDQIEESPTPHCRQA